MSRNKEERSAELEDLLAQGELDGLGLPDLLTRWPMLHLGVSRGELHKFYARRIQRQALEAVKTLKRVTSRSASADQSILLHGVESVLEASNSLVEGHKPLPGPDRRLQECLKDAVDGLATSVLHDRHLLDTEFQTQVKKLGDTSGHRLRSAREFYEEAVATDSRQRGESLRSARSCLEHLLGHEDSPEDGYAWLLYGVVWLSEQGGEREACVAFEHAAEGSSVVSLFAQRFLGRTLIRMQNWPAAFAAALRTSNFRPDAQLLLDAVESCAHASRLTDVAAMVERAVAIDPFCLISLFGEERFVPAREASFRAVLDAQIEMRGAVSEALGEWSSTIRQIVQAEKAAGFVMEVPQALREAPENHRLQAPRLDFFHANGVREQAIRSKAEATQCAIRSTEAEHKVRAEAKAEIKSKMDAAAAKREEAIEGAMKLQRNEVHRARVALADSLTEHEHSARGFAVGISMGCGGFVLYLVASVALASFGHAIGMNTPFGGAAGLVCAVPIGMAIMAQITWGVKRTALEAVLEERVLSAQEAYKEATQAADAVYRGQIIGLKKEHEAAQAAVRRVEAAERVLGIGLAEAA